MLLRLATLHVALVLLAGCRAQQSQAPPTPPPEARPEVVVTSNELLAESPADAAEAIEPTRDRLAGNWEYKEGDKHLTLRFLQPGSGEGPLTRSRDGAARLDFEGFGAVGSTTSDVVFDAANNQVVFYPPGGVDENGSPTVGPFATPEQAPKPWGKATLIGNSLIKVDARIVGHWDWVLQTTFVKSQ
ncbi:MAG TPA: hypothetical protein VFV87_10185 [Pirellulaceae bacterium]|nr:hypothetical protein [Pirellulaceae bacterium]